MSRERLAAAFDKAAEAMVELALEIRASEPEAARASVPEAGGSVPPQRPSAPAARTDESAFTHCPAHPDRNWSDGRFGKYCSGQEPEGQPHDGNWYNDKGYCRVTPRSAGAWLKQHPKAA